MCCVKFKTYPVHDLVGLKLPFFLIHLSSKKVLVNLVLVSRRVYKKSREGKLSGNYLDQLGYID